MTMENPKLDLKEFQRAVHQNAHDKGFYDNVDNNDQITKIAERIALIHSEVSEALEAARDGEMGMFVREDGKPEGFGSELADVVIRVLDAAEFYGIDLETILTMKHQYNIRRPRMHGKAC